MINGFSHEGLFVIQDHFGNGEPLWRWKEYGTDCAYSWDDLLRKYDTVVEKEEEDCGRTLDWLKVWLEFHTCVFYTSTGNMIVRDFGEKKPKSYKEYSRQGLGWSDVAAVTLTGCDVEGIRAEVLYFNYDGEYQAYVVDEYAEIGDHYHLVHTFKYWMRVYDDEERVVDFHADEIKVYRAGDAGCIIQLIGQPE